MTVQREPTFRDDSDSARLGVVLVGDLRLRLSEDARELALRQDGIRVLDFETIQVLIFPRGRLGIFGIDIEGARLRGLPSGVESERFSRRPLAEDERLAFWRRWLVEQPRGWDQSGRPGSIAYRDEELAPFRAGGPVFLYVGRYTAVKRLPALGKQR